ncbi:hypothetical protein Fmac_024872 [Flemingia macrophylla]|uniref:Uncharacterized protein n=1 Tax=Flemingia macrophylla TaxID=520843 RepID=A0ABD1LQM0_9FABA
MASILAPKLLGVGNHLLYQVWPLLLWWPATYVCSISLRKLIHSRCICSHVVNSSNGNGIISCIEKTRSWKPSSLSSVWALLLWWPAIDVCSISLRVLIHSRSWKPSSLSSVWPLLLWWPAIDVCSISLRMLIHSRGVPDVATDTSVETRKVEGKLDALVNLLTQLVVNQKPSSIARVCDHSSRGQTLEREDGFQLLAVSAQEMMPFFGARNDAIVIRVVHDVATDTSVQIRKVEGKIDALVNLLTQLVMNQKPASVARVCGIHSSNDHHRNVCPSL